MAFEDDFFRHVEQVKVRLPHVRGEEATKQALVIPLFQLLGYDVWDPREVVPEYGADFSKRRAGQSEKVDYALKINGETAVFVECKAADAELDNHDGQLARYFNSTPSVRVAILTNGVRIKVYTDLQQPNVMDEKPWMDFDIRGAKPAEIDALKKFRKSDFASEQVVTLAEEMVFYNVLVPYVVQQLREPSESWVRLIAEERFPNVRRTAKMVERLTPVLRKAIQAAISDIVARSFSAPAAVEEVPAQAIVQPAALPQAGTSTEAKDGVATTAEELEAYQLITNLIREKYADAPVTYRDAKTYFTIMQRNLRQWFIRINLERAPFWISFRHIKPDDAKPLLPGVEFIDGNQFGDTRVFIRSVSDITRMKPIVLAAYDAESVRVASGTDSREDSEVA